MESTTDFFVAQLQQIAYFSGGTESRNRPTPVPSSPLFQNKSVAKISVPRLVVFSSKTKNTCCCLFGTQELLQVVGHGIFSEAMSCFMLRNTSAWWCHKDLVNYCRGKHIYIYTHTVFVICPAYLLMFHSKTMQNQFVATKMVLHSYYL